MGGSRWGLGSGPPPPPPFVKSQVAVGFLRNKGTDHPQEAIGPLGSNCFLKEVRTILYEIPS